MGSSFGATVSFQVAATTPLNKAPFWQEDGQTKNGSTNASDFLPSIAFRIPGVSLRPPPEFLSVSDQADSEIKSDSIRVSQSGPGKYFVNVQNKDDFEYATGCGNQGSIPIVGIDEPGTTIIVARFFSPGAGYLDSIAREAQDLARSHLDVQALFEAYGYNSGDSRVFEFPNSAAGLKYLNYELPPEVTLYSAIAVPEPAGMALFAVSVAGLLSRRRRAYCNHATASIG